MAEILTSSADETNGEEEYEIETELKDWCGEMCDKECERAEAMGQRTLKLTVKNCGLVTKDNKRWNRVEVDTGFDFDKVQQILLSPPVEIPSKIKQGFCLRFVILATGKPIVLLLPYVYETKAVQGSPLQHWEFINNDLKSSHHVVDADLS